MTSPLDRELPELIELEAMLSSAPPSVRIETITSVQVQKHILPIHAISMGSQDPQVPVLGFFGGVHGLEHIGTRVVLAYLHTVLEYLKWDTLIHDALKHVRLVFIPLINPGGMYLGRRSNPNGVDLMRNAPIDSLHAKSFSLVAGHRFGSFLPWYRGPKNAPMEPESSSVCSFVRREFFQANVSISVDVHSGFGNVDRLWFPYARTLDPFPHLPEVMALKGMLDDSLPNHIYVVEPQSLQYMTHGDLWDYLYDLHRDQQPEKVYLPFSLELGSWIWVKKNPRQIFSSLGAFNPLLPHRQKRILRRHINLFDFLVRAAIAHNRWCVKDQNIREGLLHQALSRWYVPQAVNAGY